MVPAKDLVKVGDQNTGILSTMLRANGIALLPADVVRIEAGEAIDVHLMGAIDESTP